MTAVPENGRLDAFLRRHSEGTAPDLSGSDVAMVQRLNPPPTLLRALLEIEAPVFRNVQMFDVWDFLEINADREEMGDVASGLYLADDGSDGYFFLDPHGFMGLGEGFVYWVSRGGFSADNAIPVAETFLDFLDLAESGESPWDLAPTLGQRAVVRLTGLLDEAASVDARPAAELARLYAAANERGLPIPANLGDIWLKADGILLNASEREFFSIETVEGVAGTDNGFGQPGALWIGNGPEGVRYASTTGNWRGLPVDRMIAVAPGQSPETAAVLGRTADVWAQWITQDESA